MQAFMIDCVNRPGELARVCEALAARGINITSCASIGAGDRGVVGITASDDAEARTALQDAELSFRECEVVTARLENRPGTLAAATRRMSDAGVNVEYAAPTAITADSATIAFGVSDAAAARQALGEAAV
jgi:hypothetical protein